MRYHIALALPVLLTVSFSLKGEEKKKSAPPPSPLGAVTPEQMAGMIRGTMVRLMPEVLYEASPNWGQTARAPRGIRWNSDGVFGRPELKYGEKNDGRWQKIKVTADDLQDTLIFDLRHVEQVEPGRLRFQTYIAFDARVDYTLQEWESGIKLYDGSARLKFRVKLWMLCEAFTRFENKRSLLPDMIVRLRVVQANLTYDNLEVQHVAGVGGAFARLIGDAARGAIREWHPSMEREMLAKANAAIVKAADTKEVRIGLGSLLKVTDRKK